MNKIKSINSSFSRNFFLFLLASVFFWFINKLSKDYENTISYPVAYENFPKDKLLQSEPVKSIDVHVKSTGFKIASSYLFPDKIQIDVSTVISKTGNNYYLLLPQQRLSIQKQLTTGVEIDHFIKDTLVFNLGALEKKKVPVSMNSNLSFSTGFEIEGQIQIEPDSIEILGPEKVLDTIYDIKTKPLSKLNLSEDFSETLQLIGVPENKYVRLMTEEVLVSAKVKKFTQGEIEVPFTVLHLPSETSISTFPKTVKLTYLVALDDYNKVSVENFRVVCDYTTALENELSYLIPKIEAQPSFVKNVKLSPNRVEFILEK